jgi:ferredoxin-NADP reductase
MTREIVDDFADFWHFEARKPKRSKSRRQEKRKPMAAFYREKVLSVRHWTDTLFSFRATRDSGFRFQNGQFAMIGLEVERLLLLSTGTGLAPFASLIKDPDVYERFETIVLVHGCRQVSELAYGEELVAKLRDDELFGPLLSEKLLYYPTVTREPFRNRGRITDLISSEQLFNDIHQPPLNIETDRVMMCGSPGMLEELKLMFESGGFIEGSGNTPGHFVIEKAFVER